MSLSDLASLGSFVSGVAVLASLVFLFFQMRQMTEQVAQSERNQVAAIKQGRSNRIISLSVPRLEPSVAVAVSKGMAGSEDIADEQILQFRAWALLMFVGGEDSFSQHAAGLLDEDSFSAFVAGHKMLLRNPGVRVAWREMRDAWPNEFGAFYDKLLAEVPVSRDENSPQNWRTAVAAEKSTAV